MTAKTLIAALLLVAAPAWAEVVRIEVKTRADVLGGQSFAAAGSVRKAVGHDLLRGRIRATPRIGSSPTSTGRPRMGPG